MYSVWCLIYKQKIPNRWFKIGLLKERYLQQDSENGTITQPRQEFKSNYINIDWFLTIYETIVEVVAVIFLILLMEMLKVI